MNYGATNIVWAFDLWALGATSFSSLCNFYKIAFPDSLIIWFKWNFGSWSI